MNPIPALTESDRARFLAKIAPANERGCQLWTAYTNDDGYGVFRLGGKSLHAHRIAYTVWVGPILNGTEIDHRCHVEGCCTPDHLRPTTHKQNQEHRTGAQANSASGIRGVYKSTRRGRIRWSANVKHNGRNRWLGYFDTAEEAEEVAVAERLRLFTHNDADR